jgi:hypothetical protein
MEKKYKVYVAGKLDSDACGYIKNMRFMITEGEKLRKHGFAIYIPCLDFLKGLVIGEWDYADYFDGNKEWISCCDALYVLSNYKTSSGTKKEIKIAQDLNIPVFYKLNDLINFK